MADVKFSELQYNDPTAAAVRALMDKAQNLVYASVKTMNLTSGNVGVLVLTGNCTLTISGLSNNMYGILYVTGNGHALTINGQSVTLEDTGETTVSFTYFLNTLRISSGGAATSGGGLSPLASTTVTVDSSTSTTITLHWTAVTNATNYIVKIGTTNSVGAATQVYSGSSTNTVITSLVDATLYYIFVIPQGAGYSDGSPGTATRTTGDIELSTSDNVPLTFTGQSSIVTEESSGVWKWLGGAGNYAAVADQYIPAGGQGSFILSNGPGAAYDFTGITMGVDDVTGNTPPKDGGQNALWQAVGEIGGGKLYAYEVGEFIVTGDTGTYSGAANGLLKIERNASMQIIFSTSLDGGTTWTGRRTMPTTYSGNLYLKLNGQYPNDNRFNHPIGNGVL